MNTFLIIYLVILLVEAVLSTILKYAWQAEDKWDEPFYNQKTDQEKNSSPVNCPNVLLSVGQMIRSLQILLSLSFFK